MKTVDSVLLDIKNIGFDNLNPNIPFRDLKILKSISSLMVKDSYITESQGNLLLKIFKENLENFGTIASDVMEVIKTPTFNKKFREIQNIKKVTISKDKNNNFYINIEISYRKDIRKILSEIQKKSSDMISSIEGNNYLFSLTEKNVETIYQSLDPLNFEFSTEFLDLYEKIKNIDIEENLKKFEFLKLFEDKLSRSNGKEIENLKNEKDLIILDRKLRYQYKFDKNFDILPNEKLAYSIACRQEPKLFVSDVKYSLNELYESLLILKRTKILVVFDEFLIMEAINCLKLLKITLDKFKVKNTGIYFRFDNKNEGIVFNKIIADNKLNSKLEEETQVAGISNGKIPKFMLKNSWYPDAVISFTNNLKFNRTDVYCNNCDLIVYYTHSKPLSNQCHEIM